MWKKRGKEKTGSKRGRKGRYRKKETKKDREKERERSDITQQTRAAQALKSHAQQPHLLQMLLRLDA